MVNDLAYEQKKAARPDAEQSGLSFPVICIAVNPLCSDALEELLSLLPADLQSALVLIRQLPAGREAPEFSLPNLNPEVHEIVDGLKVRPGKIYISPFDKCVKIGNGRFRISRNTTSSPLDTLTSIAEQCGSKSVVVLLPGSGTDCMRGVQEVDSRGGVVLVCGSDTKGIDGLCSYSPDTDLAGGMAPEAIAGEIIRISSEEAEQNSCSGKELDRICQLISENSGLKILNYKDSVVQRRIGRRMLLNGISSPRDYSAFLARSPCEVRHLVSDFMIGVTFFFRDAPAWDVLRNRVVSQLISENTDEPLRVWNPGCATGEETYSLAMLLKDEIDKSGKVRSVQIFATDICESSLERARSGKYSEEAMRSLPEGFTAKYFVPADEGDYRMVTKTVRDSVVFAKQDVLCDPPFSKMDLIVCRNLLIYLNPEAQEKCLETFRYALKDNRFLFLGNAETVSRKDLFFVPFEVKSCRIYRKKSGEVSARLPLHLLSLETGRVERPESSRKENRNLIFSVQESLLENFGPAAVAVNRQYEILYTSGRVNRYLCFPRGAPTYNLLDLLPEEARNRARGAIYSLLNENRETFRFLFSCDNENDDGEIAKVSVTVRKVDGWSEGYLFVFEDRRENGTSSSENGSEEPGQLQQLRNELSATQEDLNRHIEQLKILNEEMQSSNEEMQAANEELETSREELQSLNEELITVNSQLQTKVEEQEETNNDLNNFLLSTNIPTLFLDNQFRIRRYTPAMERLIGFMPSDVGRSVRDFYLSKMGSGFLKDVEKVRGDLIPVEREITMGSVWFIRSVLPYRTSDERIEGVVVTFTDVSQLKTAHDNLKAAAEKFRIVADFTYDWEYWRSPDNSFLYVTPSCKRVTGYSRDEFLSDPELYVRIIHPDDRERIVRHLLDDMRRKSPCEMEFRIIRRDGAVRWLSHACQPVHDENGVCLGRRSSNRDITDRKEMEKSLRESHKDLKHAQKVAQLGSWKLNVKTNELEWSEQVYRIFGIPQDSPVTYEQFLAAVHHEDREYVNTQWKEAEESGSYEVEHRIVVDDQVKWVFEQADLSYRAGQLQSAFGIVQDITQTKKLEHNLREREQHYRSLFENSSDAIGLIDCRTWRFVDVNTKAETVSGYAKEELTGLELVKLSVEEKVEEMQRYLISLLREKSLRTEMELRRKDGRVVPVEMNASLVEIEGEPFAIGVIRDISERKEYENLLVEAHCLAEERAEELASMNRELESFSYSVSHDLRSPLRAITGFSSFLEEDYGDKLDETGRGYLKKVRENVHKMGALIDDLLSLSRVSRLELMIQEIDLGSMVSSVVAELRHAEPDRKVEVVIEEGLRVSGDARLMQIAVSNLVGNAWKFTAKTRNAKIEVGCEKGTKKQCFYIKDNGAGFDKRYSAKMFAPFQRLHSEADFTGTGIGLAIVERIVHRHGGRIWAEGEVGKGAVFRFSVK
ncbi:MAG: PAS domain S-box protein [Fibrobacterota bacterium]